MKLSRQARRSLCRTMAKQALNQFPVKESRDEHRKSVKLLAKRMYAEAPKQVEPRRIILPPERRILTIQDYVNDANAGLL